MNIAVLCAGAWGTALAIAFAPAHRVRLWSWEQPQAEIMARERANSRYLPGASFPEGLDRLRTALEGIRVKAGA